MGGKTQLEFQPSFSHGSIPLIPCKSTLVLPIMLLSLNLLAAILSATIAIPRPDGAGDPAGLLSKADAFMAQAPAADANVLALADIANLPAPVG